MPHGTIESFSGIRFLCPKCMSEVEINLQPCIDAPEYVYPVCADCGYDDLEQIEEEFQDE